MAIFNLVLEAADNHWTFLYRRAGANEAHGVVNWLVRREARILEVALTYCRLKSHLRLQANIADRVDNDSVIVADLLFRALSHFSYAKPIPDTDEGNLRVEVNVPLPGQDGVCHIVGVAFEHFAGLIHDEALLTAVDINGWRHRGLPGDLFTNDGN